MISILGRVFNSWTLNNRVRILFFTLVLGSQITWAGQELRILLVSPEQTGIFQTGGLAHATTGLAEGLSSVGFRSEVLMPYYLEMKAPRTQKTGQKIVVDLDYRQGQANKKSSFLVLKTKDESTATLFLQHQAFGKSNYFDNRSSGKSAKSYGPDIHLGESFAAFAKAAAAYIISANYDIVILNDWTTGLVATYLAEAKSQGKKVPKVIFAIHNIAYSGLFPKSLADFMGLSEKHYSIHGYEFYGQMSFLKAGLQYSDMIYTVSPQYAKEISTARFGAGLDGVIREKALQNKVTGILNGINNQEWDPSLLKTGLSWTFTSQDFAGKAAGKAELQKSFGLESNPEIPVFVLTSRLAEQKGFEYLIGALEKATQHLKAQWIVIGDGDAGYISKLQDLVFKHPENFRYQPFSGALEKQLIRYGDFFVNGAWFEPSGLNQLFALRNGTLPVVSASGGLLNSVKQDRTGILFPIIEGKGNQPYDREATLNSAFEAFEKAVLLYKDPVKVSQMRKAAMAEDHSWQGRIKKDFRVLFDYVLNEGSKTLPIQKWKIQSPRLKGLSCSKIYFH